MRASLERFTDTPEQTRDLGRAVGSLLAPGDVVSLTGDLGAGKTTFVQGAAGALHVEGPVLSPTFLLVREYSGRFKVYHLDVYRLDRLQDVLDLGFDDMLDGRSVAFIEWGDVIEGLLPDGHLQVELSMMDADGPRRRLLLSAGGREWAGRWDRLALATDQWRA